MIHSDTTGNSTTVDSQSQSPTVDTHEEHDSRFACNICLEPVSQPVVTRCGHLYCWPCLYAWLRPGMLPQDHSYLQNSNPQSTSAYHDQSQSQSAFSSMHYDRTKRFCPVCKKDCTVDTLIPIYIREPESSNAAPNHDSHMEDVQQDEPEERETEDTSQSGLRRRIIPNRPRLPSAAPSSQSSSPSSPSPSPPIVNSNTRANTLHPSPLFNNILQFFLPHPASSPRNQNPSTSIPSIHNRNQNLNGYADAHGIGNDIRHGHGSGMNVIEEDGTTEQLSRLLLMLGSFVCLCLLLF